MDIRAGVKEVSSRITNITSSCDTARDTPGELDPGGAWISNRRNVAFK